MRAVLNDCIEARGFWTGPDKLKHITFKELKAARCAIESFLPELKGRRLLLHEDNQPLVGVLTHITSRSLAMMSELMKLFLLTDEQDISFRTKYIHSAANVRADRLSQETDNADWQLAPATTTSNGDPTPSTASAPSQTSSSRATAPSGETGGQRL